MKNQNTETGNCQIQTAKKFFFASIGIENETTDCFFITTEAGESFVFELPSAFIKTFLSQEMLETATANSRKKSDFCEKHGLSSFDAVVCRR